MAKDSIAGLIPDPEALLALAPEELGEILLKLAKTREQNGMFHPGNSDFTVFGAGATSEMRRNSPYSRYERQVDLAISEAWNWLRVQGLIVPASGSNGQNGWMVFSRRGREIESASEFQQFRSAAAFPKTLLHPKLANKVWLSLARGEFAEAVFFAFRVVEEAVRDAGDYKPTDVGTKLMRMAFDKESGALTDQNQEEAEREALAHLFAGAIGSYKNPHSHRTVTITDPQEAQEQVVLASHLLRIVEARRPNRRAEDAATP